jgi:hypothetical protein
MQPDPTLLALAKMWEDEGYTGPDRHDMILAQSVERVRMAESARRPENRSRSCTPKRP